MSDDTTIDPVVTPVVPAPEADAPEVTEEVTPETDAPAAE